MESIPKEAQTILYYYGALTLVTVLLVLRRKQVKGMSLRLGGRTASAKVGAADKPEANQVGGSTAQPPAPKFSSPERSLNVVFNWNGHSWDAYEVLGLPAGSSLEKVEVTFAQALREQSADSHPFLRAAFAAIQRSA